MLNGLQLLQIGLEGQSFVVGLVHVSYVAFVGFDFWTHLKIYQESVLNNDQLKNPNRFDSEMKTVD